MAGGGAGGAEGESVGGRHSGGGRGGGRYRRGGARGHHHHGLGSDERHRGDDSYGASEDRRTVEVHEKSDSKFRQYRDSSRSFNEDSRISKQLRKLAREDDVERYMAQVQQLQESIMLNENVKYVRRHYDYILDSLYECLHAAPSPPCRWEITCCIGRVGHVMEEDVKRYVDLALERLEKWRSPEMKVLVLRCLLETLKLDGAGTVVKQVGCEFVEGLQGVLEITEAPEVMVATVDILRELHEHDSDVLKDYFQDIVDILVGWHIDYAQPPEVTRYVSAALLSFTQLWVVNISFATTLLSQFVEDMVDDIEEHQRKIGDQIGYEESFNPSICARKIATFIRVFTTVLQCLGLQADPLVSIGLTENFLAESFTKMVTGAKELMEYHKEETLLEALNQTALVLMSQAQSVPELQTQFCKVLELQHPLAGHLGFSATLSYLNLATQTLRQIGGSLSPDFIHRLVGPESPLQKLRLSTYRPVWQGVVTVYHAILSLKNVPLLQEAYKYILADLQLAQKALIPDSKEFASTSLLEGLEYTEQEAPVLVMYYMTVLAEVANTRNSIITMWALNPPLVDLFAVHLSPTSTHLSLHYPEVQYAVLYLLYSHSCKHSHYISSSSLVVGSSSFVPPSAMSPPFSSGPPGLSGSSASENLATILSTITCILKQKSMVGSNVLCLCVKWAADVVRNAESSLQQLMEKKLFLHMIEMLIMVGYHHKTSVTAEIALSLTSILNVMSPQQLHSMSKVINLCLHHMSNIDADVRNQYMTLLAMMPLSCVAFSLFDGYGPDDSEYSSNKQNESSNPLEFGSLDGSSLTTLERHYVLRSTAGHLPSNAFHTIMAFILHVSQPKGDRWQEDLFTMCQRVDRMAKLEDWTFPVLASNLRTLLWKWLAWEPAQHCIINKLRTSLGKPQDTFTTIEGSLKSRAKEVREGIQEKSYPSHHGKVGKLEEDVGDDKADEHLNGRKEEPDYPAHKEENSNGKVQILAVNLLVEFLESLEKAMFNASDGCAVAVPPPNKSVRMFFRTNRSTCVEWLSRVRAASVIVALNCGRPEVAVRHAYKLLHEFKENGNTQGADFERAVCYCVRALTTLGNGEAVAGVYYWCRDKINRRFSWIKPAIYAAGNRYEKALAGYLHFLEGGDKGVMDDLEMSGEDKDENVEAGSSCDQSSIQQIDVFDHKHLDPLVQEFLNAQIAECYSKLSKWSDLQDWVQRIKERSKDNDVGPNPSGSMNIFHDLSHIQALSKFTSGDFMGAQVSLEHGVKNTDWDKYSQWMVYAQLQKINSTLLYTMATLVTSHSRNRPELNEIVDNVGRQLDWLMQTSVISSNADLQARLLLLHQVVHEYQSMVCDGLKASSLQGGWDGLDLLPLPADFVPQVSRWVKVMAPINPSITGDSIIRLDMLSAKQARKQENFHFAEGMLMSLFGSMGKSLTDAIPVVPAGSDFSLLQASMHKEAAKLLYCQDSVIQGCETMAGIVEGLQPCIELLYKNNPSQLHEGSNKVGDIAARALLSLGKWWIIEDRRSLMLGRPLSPGATMETTPEWMNKLMEVYNTMKVYTPEELADMVDVSHPALPAQEGKMGNMLTLAIIQNPVLPKAWYVVASWCFRWGRRIIDYSGNQTHLSDEDKACVIEILSPVLCSDGSSESKLEEMCVLLGGSRGPEGLDGEDEDLRLEEIPGSQQMSTQVTNLLTSWGVAGTVSSELVPKLVNVYIRSQRRQYLVLRSAAKAYFKFLKISHMCTSKRGDLSIVATLRLLRLIIKHASELQDVLETGMAETPTTPWKTIIPQLFARLNHPEPYVRGSVSDLLCRLAQDYPHLIIFPAVVGSTGGNVTSNQASLTDMLAKYIEKKRKRRKDKQDLAVEEEDGEFLPDDDDDNVNDDSDEDEEQADEEEEEEEEEEEPEVLDQTTEDQERHTLMRNCYSALVDTLTKQVGSSISGVQMLVHELRRITVLWDELWVGTLAQHHSDLSRKSHQLNIEIARLNNNQSLTEQEKTCLIKKKYDIIFKPLLFVLEQLADITSTSAETPHEKHFQEMYGEQIVMALQALRQPENHFDPHASLSQLKNMYQMLQQRAHKRASTSLKMADVSPNLAALKDTMIAMPGVVSSSNQIVTIASVDSTITILPTKTKPKKLSFQGSDGKKYTYLFKGLEDLHLDERIMQFLEIVNTMLAKNQNRSGGSLYRARYYSVIPLGPKSGLIQWVGSATPLFGLYKRWQQREAQAQLLKAHSSTTSMHSQAPQVPRPSELFYSKLSPRLREEQISVDHRKEWPLHILRDVLKDIIKETPSDLLARELWMCSTNASEWWKLTRTYSVSTAVMSIIGYIIGLGDRHLDNVLVNLTSGEVVHIDYNVCFEKGKNLRVPEKVPYRMTQNIETALGVTGVEGIFRSACEQVLRTMRRGRETLLTLLEAFVYDPLVDWTPDSEGGYAGAVYGGDQALVSEARQNRQQLERGLTLSMFSVRVAEMKADWVLNKTEVLNAVPRVKASLELWANVHQVLCKEDGQLQDGHHLMALLKEAEANPQHPLYGLRPRFEEYSIVKKSLEKAKDLLNSRINETKNWNDSYKVASSVLQGGQMNEWRTKIAMTGSLLASFRPVLEFLTKAGQAPLAAQCEHTEVELHKAIGQVHSVATSAMDLLTKYGTIWSHYPHDHLEKHRVSQQLAWLTSLSQSLSISSVQAVIAKGHQESADAATINYACTTDMQLHKKSSHLNSTLQKTFDRMRGDGLNDAVGIVNGVQGTSAGLSTIAAEVGGIAALTCAFLNSLTQLSSVRLRADKSASGAGEGLVEMTVSGLWWLGECSVTLGCILELVTLLARYSPPASPLETTITHAISVLHDVFGALHELILNTNGIIIVEGLRLLWRSESSVVNIVSALQEVLTAVPTPPHELVTKLQSHLRHTILLMSSPHEGAVQEATTLHNRLTEVISHLTTNSAPQDNMNQGQMLLMGFHLLFENVDSQLDKLVSALMNGVLPQPWRRVDTIKEAAEVMGPLQDPALCEVVRAMLRVKKVQTMIEFFTTAYQFSPAVKIKSSSGGSSNGSGSGVYEEDKLLRIVRRYASDCVLLLLFGLPTHLSSHLLLLHAQKMGVNVTGYIEARDVGTECRVSVEGIVQESLERCFHQNSLDPSLMTRASTAVNLHLAAIRKKLLLRHWEGEVEGMRASLQRVTVQHHSHQWYYEDLLKQHVMAPPIQPKIEKKWLIPSARGGLLGDLRTSVSTMVALHQNVTELHEKYSTLTTNVQQRLKWGAGSNPSIAQALEEFTTGVEVGLASVSDLLRMTTEIVSICNSVLHYEALRTQTVDALKFDANFTSLLNTCQESCMLTERYPVSVSPQEEMLITLCPLTGDLDTQWVQQASNAVSDHIERLTKQVKEKGNTVNSAAEGVKMAVISLRSHLSTHHKLISDVRTLLKSMAKYEGTGISGVEDYLILYRNYSESMTSLIRQLLHEPLMPQKIPVYIQTLQHVSKQTSIIYDQLLDFGNRCVTEEKGEEHCGCQTGPTGDARTSRPPLQRQLSLVMSSPVPAVSGSPDYKPKVKRHPVTGKVVQEHNVYALSVWRRVKVKLEGHDPDPSRKATVHEQVDYTIREATNHDNLATLYEGWTPWV